MSELINTSIKDLLDGLKNKKFSCQELTEAHLEQINKTDEQIKAFITVLPEEAIESAKQVDKKIKAGELDQALLGIPAAIKDVIATKDTLSTAASQILYNYHSPYDATVVERLKQAGYVNLGKVNCDAFAHGISTENSDYFITKNPYDLERVSGGSSGGSTAAVAARQAVFSIGTDTGGSIRLPAHFCGVVGLKPTYGRVSRYGLMSMASSNDCPSITARSVEDVAAVLQVIAGQDKYDATSAAEVVPNYIESLSKENLKGVKIGLPKEYFIEGIRPEVEKKIRQAISELEKNGAQIIEISLPHTEYAIAVYYTLMCSEVSSNLARYDGIKYGYSINNHPEINDQARDLLEVYTKSRKYGFGAEAKRRIMLGTYALSSGYFDQYYNKASKVRTLIKQDFVKVFSKVDFILTPVSPNIAFKIGSKKSVLETYLADIFTCATSLAGLPAIVMPCGKVLEDKKELPTGFQLIGNYFSEDKLLQSAKFYENINQDDFVPGLVI